MIRTRPLGLILVLVFTLAAAGCGQPGPGTATPVVAGTLTALPDDGRGATALDAYPLALVKALEWDPAAQLTQITITRLMEKNLGLPNDLPGWFYMFQVPGSPVEFYIKTVNGAVSGSTEAQPIIVGEAPYKYVPIDLGALKLDSDDALRLFMDNGGQAYLAANPAMLIDYRLIHLEGTPNPVWSIFDATDLSAAPLFNVDAVTSGIVKDPYAP